MDKMKVVELKAALRKMGLPVSGLKAALHSRLLDAVTAAAAATAATTAAPADDDAQRYVVVGFDIEAKPSFKKV